MVVVNIEKLISANANDVFEFISNFENNPIWQKGMVEAKFTSPPPLGVGSTYDQIAKFLRKKIITTFKVEEFVPHRLVKASSISGSFPITFTRSVEVTEDNECKVFAKIEGEAKGFFRIASPFLDFMVKKSIQRDYERLKKYFEKQN